MKKGLKNRIAPDSSQGNLGTFAGVFTPSVLTILGIILFLRLGYVVGNAGLGRALLIIGLANAISVLTSFSLSAIATNLKVKGGGDYYLISRTLGVEFGGAIGIVLFLAQSVSIAFYSIGFGEALAGMLPVGGDLSPRLIAVCAVAFLFLFAWMGADWATRFQYVVMALLASALFSFFAGGFSGWESGLLTRNWDPGSGGVDFWLLFAIFFPAVTGFTQGVSMSGDLKDPGKSLPLGTFCAVGISIVVYFGVAVIFAGTLPLEALSGDYAAMKQVAWFSPLIDAGVIAATLSSAMASFLGAPRILQSLAGDRIISFLIPFSKGSGRNNNPRRGVLLSTGIAFLTISLGNLNVIAPVVSMFFLISYGLLNYATFFEARSASPSFRPRLKWFDRRLSLLGFLGCLGAILAIDLAAGLIAVAVLFAIYQYLKRTAGPARWADSRRSYHLQMVREHLIAAANETEHPRDWRPQILAMTGDESRRSQLLQFAYWIQGSSGLTTAVKVIEGSGLKVLKQREQEEEALRRDIASNQLSAFPLVITTRDFAEGGYTLLQSFGIGPIKANIVLLNWFQDSSKGVPGIREFSLGRNLRMAFRLGCSIIVLNAKEDVWARLEETGPEERRIDLWWLDDASSHLMLLLAYLMTRSEVWGAAHIRVLAPGDENTESSLRNALDEARVDAEPIIVKPGDLEGMVERSAESTMVLLPFRLAGSQIIGPLDSMMEEICPRLPVAAFVLAAKDVDLDAEPEEGKAAEMARAFDEVERARKKVRVAEKEAERALEAVKRAEKGVEELIGSTGPGADRKEMERIEREIQEAKEAQDRAEKALRRAAKTKAGMEEAEKAAEELGVKIERESDDGEKPPTKETE